MKKIYLFLLPLVISAASSCSNYGSREITILYTNDVHGALGYDEASGKVLSYASIAKMKQDLKHQGKKVLLFDCGDHTSGGVYCSYLKGLPIVNIMNQAGYDAAIFGNHEFDNTFEMVEAYENLANFPYIATNLYHCTPDGKITTAYTNTSEVFKLGDLKVGVIGVSTPYTMVTSTPSYFQDDNGNYIYSFLDQGNELYNKVQSEVDALRKDCKYVVCLAHMGGAQGSKDLFSSENLVKNTTGIDVVLDGHSHETIEGVKVKNKDNKDVLITQTGSHMNNIGKLTINSQGKITNQLVSSYKGKDELTERLENNVIKHIDDEFKVNVATSSINFIAHDANKDWQVRRRETNLGDLCADAFYYTLNEVIAKEDENAKCDVAIVNSGAVRNDVPAKTWQLLDCRNVHTFDNNVAVRKMTGKTLKIYLEFATRNFKDVEKHEDEIGVFPQVQGVKFEIDTSKDSKLVIDDKGNYESGDPTPGRIVNLKIYKDGNYITLGDDDECLVGGSAYVLEDCGDGCTMFKNTTSMYRTSAYVDYQVLAEYVKSFKKDASGLPTIKSENSPLYTDANGLIINYENENPGGSGRFGAIA